MAAGHIGVTEDGVIELERLREFLVDIRLVDTGGEIGNLELVERLAVLGKRLAFLGAATGERSWGTRRGQPPIFP